MMKKGDRVRFQVVLTPQIDYGYPTKQRTMERRAFKNPREGWFMGWSMRFDGRIEWENDEVGNIFIPGARHKVAMVALDDGTVSFRKLVAVLVDDLEEVECAGEVMGK